MGAKDMNSRRYKTIFALLLVAFSLATALQANPLTNEDTDTRMVDARVVEVAETRISVIARSGVEHVIAINSEDTRVMLDGNSVSLADLRVGDVVTIHLCPVNRLKFARNISVESSNNVARAPR
jgi:hypothetical protein